MPKKTVDVTVDAPKMPRISVLERRLQNPFGEPSQSISFKEKNVTGRWFNDAARSGQIHRAKELGWIPVTRDMIVDMDSIGSHTISAADQITRGERGQEVLMWMPTDEFQQIQWAKTKHNLDRMRDMDQGKRDLVNAAAKQYGGTAAEYMNERVGPIGGVTDNYERIERMPDTE